jgi:hypothetical protein
MTRAPVLPADVTEVLAADAADHVVAAARSLHFRTAVGARLSVAEQPHFALAHLVRVLTVQQRPPVPDLHNSVAWKAACQAAQTMVCASSGDVRADRGQPAA